MSDTVYRVTDIVGSARSSLEEAIHGAVRRASTTLGNVSWFEVDEIWQQRIASLLRTARPAGASTPPPIPTSSRPPSSRPCRAD